MDNRIVIKKYEYLGSRKTWKTRRHYRYVMKCIHCGKEFEIIAREYNRGRGRYCCHECSQTQWFGEGNPRWNNGKRITKTGYILIHPSLVPKEFHYLATYGKYIPEHRLVMAKNLGRKLDKKELIHHLNGIKNDNRPKNLVISDSRNHEKHTLWKLAQKRIKELEEEVKRLKN